MSNILKNLNPEQRKAAEQIKGPVLILAGAGTGKTRTITHRIAHMIGNLSISPANILAVTFTNKAAREMKNRVEDLLPQGSYSPMMGTFHAVSVRILKEHIELLGYKENFSIYDNNDSLKVIKDIFKDLILDPKKINPKAILNSISGAKNQLLTPEKYTEHINDDFTQLVARIYKKYQDTLKKSNAVDFDDLIMLTVHIFQEHPKILEKYQKQWQFIHVDEYQDVNYAQHIWTSLLSEMYQNICVVGDDWQGIYSWRGADINNILKFEKQYPNTMVIKLEKNYRSTQIILDAAQDIISKNINRTHKELWTDKKEDIPIEVLECMNEKHEGDLIINSIEKRIRNNEIDSFSDAVILYRTNAQSRAIEESCLRNKIPYQIIGGTKFYERMEIKDILAYLTLLVNPIDEVALARIINIPGRGIGTTSWGKVVSYARDNKQSISSSIKQIEKVSDLSPSAQKKFSDFYHFIESLRHYAKSHTASSIFEEVLERTGYIQYIDDKTETAKARIENLQELLSVSNKYDELSPKESLSSFLEEISLISDMDTDIESSKLTLMTMHTAKGLEFTAVYIAGMEEQLFPHIRALYNEEEMEEERRLAYVAITRAKKFCHLSYCKSRMLYGDILQNKISRFIQDISQNLLSGSIKTQNEETLTYSPIEEESYDIHYSIGQIVTHPHFGKGKIQSIRGDLLTIDFSIGQKTIAASIAPLSH